MLGSNMPPIQRPIPEAGDQIAGPEAGEVGEAEEVEEVATTLYPPMHQPQHQDPLL